MLSIQFNSHTHIQRFAKLAAIEISESRVTWATFMSKLNYRSVVAAAKCSFRVRCQCTTDRLQDHWHTTHHKSSLNETTQCPPLDFKTISGS